MNVSAGASARLARLDVGRAVLRGDVIEVAGAFSPRRLPALRALPERRFDADRKTWTVPLTRAGALAILDLADHTDQLVTTQRARRALQRSAARRASTTPAKRDSRRRAHESDAAVADRALEALHGRSGLRQPRPRARGRAGHRVVRSHPGQSASGRAVTRPSAVRVRERPVRREGALCDRRAFVEIAQAVSAPRASMARQAGRIIASPTLSVQGRRVCPSLTEEQNDEGTDAQRRDPRRR